MSHDQLQAWRTVTIEDLGQVVTGRTPPSSKPEMFGSEYPFITPSDMSFGLRRITTERSISLVGSLALDRIKLPPKSVAFVCIGATIGKVCLTSEDSFTNQQINSIIVDCDRHSPEFVYYLMLGMVDKVKALAGGAATPIVNKSSFCGIPVSIPPIETQSKIAFILSAYDDLIENNTRRIEILEEMARRLYKEWFCDLRFPGCEMAGKDWSVVQFGSVLKSSIGGGWGKDEIDDEHTNPGHVVRGTDIPSVKRLDVLRCPYRYHKLSNIRSRRLEAGDIVMEVSGGSHDQSVGRTLYVSKELLQLLGEDVICASFCKRLVVDDSVISPLLVYYHLDYVYRSGGLDQFQVQSTGIKNFQFTPFLEKHEISIPPVSLQEKFTTAVVPLLALHQVLGKKNANLRTQRDLLLPKLISGEIDVSDIPMPT